MAEISQRRATSENATPGGHARSSSPAPKPDTAPAEKQAATAVADGTAPDPGLLGRIAVAIAACRQSRCPLSLLLVQLDRVDELVVTRGVQGFQSLHQSLGTICQNVAHAGAMCVMHGEAGFAVILPDCERRQAIQWGSHLAEQLRRVSPDGADPGKPGVSLSAGVATVALPPRNFLPEEIFSAAERCLYGSHASGGGVIKSIEIY